MIFILNRFFFIIELKEAIRFRVIFVSTDNSTLSKLSLIFIRNSLFCNFFFFIHSFDSDGTLQSKFVSYCDNCNVVKVQYLSTHPD